MTYGTKRWEQTHEWSDNVRKKPRSSYSLSLRYSLMIGKRFYDLLLEAHPKATGTRLVRYVSRSFDPFLLQDLPLRGKALCTEELNSLRASSTSRLFLFLCSPLRRSIHRQRSKKGRRIMPRRMNQSLLDQEKA